VIVSHKYRFIFVKRAKTAGTSIEVVLSPLCGPDDIITPVDPPEDGHQPRNYEGLQQQLSSSGGVPPAFLEHLPAWMIAKWQPNLWAQYFSFCVERNPWDKLVSSFHYYLAQPDPKQKLGFNAYVRLGMKYFGNRRDYTDDEDRILVDRVLLYENLETEIAAVFAELGIPFADDLVRAKSAYRPAGDDYCLYYDTATRELVARNYAWEIDHFEYAF
jgi:hypothetical protein